MRVGKRADIRTGYLPNVFEFLLLYLSALLREERDCGWKVKVWRVGGGSSEVAICRMMRKRRWVIIRRRDQGFGLVRRDMLYYGRLVYVYVLTSSFTPWLYRLLISLASSITDALSAVHCLPPPYFYLHFRINHLRLGRPTLLLLSNLLSNIVLTTLPWFSLAVWLIHSDLLFSKSATISRCLFIAQIYTNIEEERALLL
jgi:hypothetical protein